MDIKYSTVFKGFEFNLAWFVSFTNALVELNKDKEKAPLLEPMKLLYSDLAQIVKAQGGFISESQSHTSEQAQEAN